MEKRQLSRFSACQTPGLKLWAKKDWFAGASRLSLLPAPMHKKREKTGADESFPSSPGSSSHTRITKKTAGSGNQKHCLLSNPTEWATAVKTRNRPLSPVSKKVILSKKNSFQNALATCWFTEEKMKPFWTVPAVSKFVIPRHRRRIPETANLLSLVHSRSSKDSKNVIPSFLRPWTKKQQICYPSRLQFRLLYWLLKRNFLQRVLFQEPAVVHAIHLRIQTANPLPLDLSWAGKNSKKVIPSLFGSWAINSKSVIQAVGCFTLSYWLLKKNSSVFEIQEPALRRSSRYAAKTANP